MGQAFLANSEATTKVKAISLGEGLTNSNHSVLLELITKSGLMPVLTSTDKYTFFAPSEKSLLVYQNASPDDLRNLFSEHIIVGALTANQLKDGADLKTLSGNTIKIYRKKGSILVNGMQIEEADQLYNNGVWHQLKGCLKSAKTISL